MINIYFLLNLISILLFVECVCSSCCSYPKINPGGQNTVAATAAVVNASNVHFDHVFENGRLPSGRIIRCGTCG